MGRGRVSSVSRGSGHGCGICLKSRPQFDGCRNQTAWVQLWLAFHPTARPYGTLQSSYSIMHRPKHTDMTGYYHSTESLKLVSFLFAQMIYPTWSVPCTLSSNSPLWRTVSHFTVHQSTKVLPLLGCDVLFSCLPPPGCKVDMFDLKVEAVNTHRDRPLVSFWPFNYVLS